MFKIIFIFWFITSINYAYRQHVHQYITVEAYNLLKLQLGFEIPTLQSSLGGTSNWYFGEKPWQRRFITTGAYREDIEDIVFKYSNHNLPEGASGQFFTGFLKLINDNNEYYSSVTHFWYADDGDCNKVSMTAAAHLIPPNVPPIMIQTFKVENAYQKILRFAYADKIFEIKYPSPPGNAGFRLTSGNWIYLNHCGGFGFKYNSLIELFKSGKAWLTGYYGDCPLADWISCNYGVILGQTWRDTFVWEILGRMCHLLQDMSVPAHTNIDPHGPDDALIDDYYENYFGWDFYWNAENTYTQIGGMINPYHYQSNDPLHFLMYTTNQMANHFATQGPHKKPNNDYFGGNGTSAEIAYLNSLNIPQYGIPTSDDGPWGDESKINVRDKMLPQAIRATAGLLYWFAMESDLLQNTLVKNSFGGGNVSINGTVYGSGYRIPAWSSPAPVNLQAYSQVVGSCSWTFQSWQKIQNGVVVQTFNEPIIIITPEENTTYQANFISVPPIISSFTQSPNPLYKGYTGTVTCNLSQGHGGTNFNWSIISGNTGFSILNVNSQTVSIHYSNTDAIEKTNSGKISSSKEIQIEGQNGAVLKCEVSNSAGSHSKEVIINLATTPHGCPFVYTWNGDAWVEDNNILPQSQDTDLLGQDVTDFYQLYTKPILEDGKYFLAVGEFELEKSYLDQLKLLIVDHPKETFITVDDNGEIIQFAKPAYFANAQLDSNDVYKYLAGLDSVRAEVSSSDTLSLSFEDVSTGIEKWLLLIGQKQKLIAKEKIAGSVLGGGMESKAEFSSFRLRKNPTYQWILVPDGNSSSLQVDIAFQSDAEIDFTELSHKLELPFTVFTPQLIKAEHTLQGEVTSQLNQIDEEYIELNKDEMITLEYSAPAINEEMERTFIFISKGRYESLKENILVNGKTQTGNKPQNTSSVEKTNIVYEYGLLQNYPNPFNPLTNINYQVKEKGFVSLKVFDMLGKEVAILVNETKEEGQYSIMFDASNLPSGIYVYSLRVNDFVQNKKMTLLK